MNLTKKKNKFVAILGILAFVFALSPVSAFAAEPMDDISNHWAKEQIQEWVDNNYITGYPDGTFKPDNDITRAEFMTIVNKAFGYTEKAEISYSDVADGSWYEDAVAIAKAAGYINGYPDGTMKPNAPITRQEATVIIAKIDSLDANETAAGVFTDAAGIPSWSKGSVGACVEAEIFNGYPDNTFLGANHIERGESVVALSKALDYKNAHEITAAVYGINAEGFHLAFSPAVEGLTQSAVTLKQGDNNVTVEAISTTDNGATYAVTAGLEVGKTYDLTLSIDGYDFGDAMTFTVLSDQAAADAVNNAIAALPATAELTLNHKAAVAEAKIMLEALTTEQAALVTDENKTKLDAAIDKMDELQTAADQAEADQTAADAVIAKITALPDADSITLDNEAAVNEAETAYNALTDTQKALISTENLTKLNAAVAKIDSLQTPGETVQE